MPRHDPCLGFDVIRLCEAVAGAAQVGTPSRGSVQAARRSGQRSRRCW